MARSGSNLGLSASSIRDPVQKMHITLTTLAYLAAALIAGTAPVRAQMLPFYDVDGETARRVTEAQRGRNGPSDKNLGETIGEGEQVTRDELAKRWGSYDQTKRMWCVADKGIVTIPA